MNKHIFNALMYDICNWSLNITLMAFVYSVSPWYALAIGGLFILRFGADVIYRKSLYNETVAARSKLLNDIQAHSLPTQDEYDTADFDQMEFPDEIIESPKTTDDKKVH